MPALQLPPAFQSATLVRWLVAPAMEVAAGQPFALIATATEEFALPATASGVVSALLVDPGDTLAAEAALLELEAAAAAPKLRVSPVARALASAHGLDVATLAGSGPAGRVVKADVLALVAPASPPAQRPGEGFCVAEQIGASLEKTITVTPSAPKPAAAPKAPVLAAPQPQYTPSAAPTAIAAQALPVGPLLARVAQAQTSLARAGFNASYELLVLGALAETLARMPQLRLRWFSADEALRSRDFALSMVVPGGLVTVAQAGDHNLKGLARALATAPGAAPTASAAWSIAFAAAPEVIWSAPRLPEGAVAILHCGAPRMAPVVREAGLHEEIAAEPQAIFTLVYDTRLLGDDAVAGFFAAFAAQLSHG